MIWLLQWKKHTEKYFSKSLAWEKNNPIHMQLYSTFLMPKNHLSVLRYIAFPLMSA
jgi:hypothetical protein